MVAQGAPDPSRPWRLEWRGRVWRESDVRVKHVAFICLLNQVDDWQVADLAELNPARGPLRAMHMIAAFLADEAGPAIESDPMKVAEILQDVGEAKYEELLAAIKFD